MMIRKTLLAVAGMLLVIYTAVPAAKKRASTFTPVKTKLMRGGDKAQNIHVDLNGAKNLYLAVTYGPDNYNSDQAIWAEPRLVDSDGNAVDLTTVAPNRSQVGWGQLFTNRNQHGKPLSIAGETFSKGFWAHGPSLLHFQLDGKYTQFQAKVGIDTGAGGNGSVEFIVTSTPPKMPSRAQYAGKRASRAKHPVLPKPSPAAEAPHRFNAHAAKKLLDNGIDRLVFIRRYTLSANHVYTEYVNSRWTPGGGLVVLDLKTGVAADLVPELTAGVVNRFDISYDAKRIVFDYKKANEEGYRIYEVGIDGKGLRQLTFPQENEAELVSKYGSGDAKRLLPGAG